MNSINQSNPFIDNNNDKEESCFKYYKDYLKKRLFKVFTVTVSYESMTKNYLTLISIIETFQILSFSFSSIYKSTWAIQEYYLIFEFIQKIFDFFLIVPYFQNDSFTLYKVVFFIVLVFLFLLFFIFLSLFIFIGRISSFPLWPVTLFKTVGELYVSILILPILRAILPFFNCSRMLSVYSSLSEKEKIFCSDSNKKETYIAFAAIALFLVLLFGLMFSVLLFDTKLTVDNKANSISAKQVTKFKMDNYFNYNSSLSNYYKIVTLVLKLTVSICFINIDKYINDFDNNSNIVLSVILCTLSLIFWFVIYKENNLYSLYARIVYKIESAIILFTNILLLCNKILLRFNNTSIDCFVEIWVLMNILIILYNIFKKEDISAKLYQYHQNCSSPSNALEYIVLFRKVFDNFKFNEVYKTIFYGYIYNHTDHCQDEDCPLRRYIESFENVEDDNDLEEKQVILYINELYAEYINRFPDDIKLRISYSFFLIDKMKKINFAKMQLFTAYFYKPGFIEEFSLYRLSKLIEEYYLHCDDENVNLDIASSIIFNQYFITFKEIIQKIAIYYLDFWMTFIQDDITIKKIKKNGFRILSLITQLFNLFSKMQSIKPKDKESLQIYGDFLIDILNEKTLGQSYIDRSNEINVQGVQLKLFDNDISKLSDDGSPVIISSIGVDENNLIITQITAGITRLFGYPKLDLIGKDINVLLPEELRKNHNEVVNRYIKINMNVKNIEERKITGLAMHKAGYIFPVKMSCVLMPNLTSSANVAMIFRKEQQYSFNYNGYFLTNKELDILYFSSQCSKMFEFNERILWKIKNTKKIKSEERVKLSDLIDEFQNDDIDSYINEPHKVVHIVKGAFNTKRSSNEYPIEETNTKFSLLKSTKFLENITKRKLKALQQSKKNVLLFSNPNNQINQVYLTIHPIKFRQKESEFFSIKIQYKLQYSNMPNSPFMSPNVTYNNSALSPSISPYNPSSSVLFSPQKVSNQIMSKPYVFDFKFYSDQIVKYDKSKHHYCIDFNHILNSPNKIYLKHVSLFQKKITSKVNSMSSNSSMSEEESSEDSGRRNYLLEDNIYNTFNFKNYGIGIQFFGIDEKTMTIEPNRELSRQGKKCQELENFFDDDTMKYNDYLDEDDDELNDKIKYEIKKIDIFSSYNDNKIPSNVMHLRISSFFGIVCFIIISTLSYIYYTDYLDKCETYTKGLSRISSLLNYTITSSDFVFDYLLLTQNRFLFSNDQLIEFQNVILAKLNSNAKEISNIISVVDKENIISKVTEKVENKFKIDVASHSDEQFFNDSPLLLNLTHLVVFEQITGEVVFAEESIHFNEATFRLMSSIFSLTQYYNYETTFFDKDAFFLCFNSVNNYFSGAMKFMSYISNVIQEFTPGSTQLILIHISIGLALILYIGFFFLLRTPLMKMNTILMEIITVKNDEVQYIVKQGENFSKKIMKSGMNNLMENEEENSKEEERENEFDKLKEKDTQSNEENANIKKKKRSMKYLRKKLKRPITDDLIILFMELIVFSITVLYFVIQYIIVHGFNANLDQFVSLFSISYYYIADVNLISNSVKFSYYLKQEGYDPDLYEMTILNGKMEEKIKELFDILIQNKDALTKDILFSKFISKNFTNYYNEYIMGDNILDNRLLNITLLRLKAYSNFTFDTIHAYFYNSVFQLQYFMPAYQSKESVQLFFQANEAKNSILIPFMKLFCDLTYDDIFKAGNRNRRIVLIFYILFFLLMVTLYFSLWRPIENWLDRDVS